MDDDQNAPKRIHAHGHKPALTLGVRVLNRESGWIAECLCGVREANPVFGEVRLRPRWIEFDPHLLIMHIQCILSSLTVRGQVIRYNRRPMTAIGKIA
jgi:hypothetical protein